MNQQHREAIAEGQRKRHQRQRNDPVIRQQRLYLKRMRLLHRAHLLEREADALRAEERPR